MDYHMRTLVPGGGRASSISIVRLAVRSRESGQMSSEEQQRDGGRQSSLKALPDINASYILLSY